MKIRKYLIFLFALTIMFSIVGCEFDFGGGVEQPDPSEDQPIVVVDETKVVLYNNGQEIKAPIVLLKGETTLISYNQEEIGNDFVLETSSNVVAVTNKAITARTVGVAEISAKATKDDKEYTASFEVIVFDFSLALEGNPKALDIATVTEVLVSIDGLEASYELESSDTSIAKVSGTSLVALKEGTISLKVTVNYLEKSYEKTISVTVAKPLPKYTVTFKDASGNVLKEEIVEKGQSATAPTAPERLGYEFSGWSRDYSNVAANITVTTKYTIHQYPIVFIVNTTAEGVVMPSDMTYTVEQEFDLPVPTAPFEFLGWYTCAECTGEAITHIAKGTTEEMELYAKWDETSYHFYTITYVYEDGRPNENACENIDQFIAQFWKELYAWSGSSKSLEDFKSAALAKWKSGAEYSDAKVYSAGNPNIPYEGYFVSCEANFDRWMPWMNEFDKQVTAINGQQTAWGSAYVGYLRLYALVAKSASYWTEARMQPLYSMITVPESLPTTYEKGASFTIPNLMIDDGRTFLGWVDANNNPVSEITESTRGNLVLYATWSNATPAENFEITQPARIEKYDTYQLVWSFTPANTTNKRLVFRSSDPTVLAVNEKGLITTYKEGTVTLTVEVLADANLNVQFTIEVYVNPFIDGSFETSSIMKAGDHQTLNARKYNFNDNLVWESSDESIALVVDGFVTAVAPGFVTITAKSENDANIKFEYGVTVSAENEMFTVIETAHNTDSFVRRNLNVAYAYLTDVILSASDLLFNEEYEINREYEAKQATVSSNHGGTRPSTEFICVHYTAGYNRGSTARANASYFANGGSTSSIHYTTGNDGIFHILDDSLIGYHAGDGAGASSNFEWISTGVKATQGEVKPVWGVVANASSSTGYYFTLNGQATTIAVPVKGTYSSGAAATLKDPANSFSYFGPAWKVVNGYYYMGTTWVCFTQNINGVISSRGGNRNSIGIETACNQGSDLWFTYQKTAQLVAHLLQTYNLNFYRVVGHNAFSGKDCPQTLLANGGELWELFMDLVRREYELLTTMSDYTITSKSNNPELLSDNGRILAIPKYSTTVSYTVTVKNNQTGETKTETFATIVHGWYTE